MHAMCDRRPRARHPHSFGPGARGEWAAWLPLLFIGAMMFWTVALGLGGWSLMVVSDGAMVATPPMAPSATALEPKPGVAESPPAAVSDGIPVQVQVNLEESQDPEDASDNAGTARSEARFGLLTPEMLESTR